MTDQKINRSSVHGSIRATGISLESDLFIITSILCPNSSTVVILASSVEYDFFLSQIDVPK